MPKSSFFSMKSFRSDKRDGVLRVYDVPSVAFNCSKTPSMPRVAQGVSAREDDITGLRPA